MQPVDSFAVEIYLYRQGVQSRSIQYAAACPQLFCGGSPEGFPAVGEAWAGAAGVAGAEAAPLPDPLFTRSFNSLLGLKYGMRLEGTSTLVPVLGLRPTRGWRWRVRKLPNPRISILSPPRKDFTTLSKMASTITSESLRVISTTRETSSINSALVICYRPSPFPFMLITSSMVMVAAAACR